MIATNNRYVNGVISMAKSIAHETEVRLSQTEEGKALLDLVRLHGNPTDLARKLGVDPQSVRQWIYSGAIPKTAAIEFAQKLKCKPASLRPDLPASAWIVKIKEEKPPREPVARTQDAKLLVKLADKLGGVKALCDAAFCTPGDYHNWKTRGRIPAIKLPTFLALDQ